MKNKKATAIFFGLIIVVIIVGGIFLAKRNSTDDAVRIGVILPLTGSLSYLGVQSQKAVQVAVDDINSQGGINGKKLEALFEDSKGDPKEGVTAFNKLISLHKVKAVISQTTGVARAIAPLSQKHKVILIANCVHPAITKESSYAFRIYVSAPIQGRAMADYAISKKLTGIAAFWLNAEAMATEFDSFRRALEASGGRILYSDTYELSQKDFKPQLVKILARKPDALAIFGYGLRYHAILKQLKEMGFEKPILGNTAFLLPAATAEGTALYNNAVFASFPHTMSDPRIQEFVTKYERMFKVPPSRYLDFSYFYDSTRLLADAIAKAGYDADSIKGYLVTVKNYQGLSGPITIGDDRDADVPMAMARYRNGEPELVR